MVRYENECCDCATPLYPCIGDLCPRRRVPHYHCDECDTECTLYEYEDRQLCSECLLEEIPKVEGSC